MATTAPPHPPANVNVNVAARTRRPSSTPKEPRVRSILLSGGSRPPGLHAQDGDELATSNHWLAHSSDAHPATHPSEASTPPPQADVDDRRPPSIHLSEAQDGAVEFPAPRTPHPVSIPDPNSNPDFDDTMPVAPRPRRMTLDLPSSPIDVLYASDAKLVLEGTSPKPCIVPGNALHLIDDDPAAPRSATPPSVIIVGSEHEGQSEHDGDDGDGDGDGEEERAAGGRPAQRVRFRSRVRITSGVHRHRASQSHHSQNHSRSQSAQGGSTPGSTTSGSPSSSISAPLRYQADENAALGPIGKRLSAYAASGGWGRRTQVGVQHGGLGNGYGNGYGIHGGRGGGVGGRGTRGVRGGRGYHERTPLLRPPPGQSPYSEDEDEDPQGLVREDVAARAAALRREEEVVFGKWPWRIFNRHWWWWHVEPILCCCCNEDSDYEEF